MGNPGFMVMMRMLCGNEESAKAFQSVVGKTITDISHTDEALRFVFSDGAKLELFDNGQSCCESRYMRTDDDLTKFIGSRLLGAKTKDAPDQEDEYGTHEVQFLEVETTEGSFVMSNHNEHNGYYGGFSIEARIPA